ncbi:MAG: FG-GAP-like repeat-containing protein, partial [Spirochaetaceae bacterium]
MRVYNQQVPDVSPFSKTFSFQLLRMALVLAGVILLVACANPGGGDTTPPASVTGLGATVLSATQIELEWTDPVDADLGAIEIRWSPARPSDAPLGIDPGRGTTVVAGLLPETAYTLTVVALDAAGNRSGPREATGTTLEVTFSAGSDITTTADAANSVYAADLDGDGDMDVVSTSQNDGRVVWYENTDGRGTFSTGTDITDAVDSPRSVYAADLDG